MCLFQRSNLAPKPAPLESNLMISVQLMRLNRTIKRASSSSLMIAFGEVSIDAGRLARVGDNLRKMRVI